MSELSGSIRSQRSATRPWLAAFVLMAMGAVVIVAAIMASNTFRPSTGAAAAAVQPAPAQRDDHGLRHPSGAAAIPAQRDDHGLRHPSGTAADAAGR